MNDQYNQVIVSPLRQGLERNMYAMMQRIDQLLKQLKPKTIFLVGLSRVGKSTTFNFINNVTLTGVQNQEEGGIIYQPKLQNANAAFAKHGNVSVTLYPNIVEKQQKGLTLADMAGYLDSRQYQQVICVSYALKKAFLKVETCQFALVVKKQFFTTSKDKLISSFEGFIRMFRFDQMSEDQRIKLLSSVTLIITKTQPTDTEDISKDTPQKFTRIMAGMIASYPLKNNPENIKYLLQYFSDRPQQFFFFHRAYRGKDSPQCSIVADHFQRRIDFNMKMQNQAFRQQFKKDMFRLPFDDDIKNMGEAQTKMQIPWLEAQLKQRINSYKVLAQILRDFFIKAINPVNLFNPNSKYREQFQKIRKYIEKNDVYFKKESISNWTELPNIFSKTDSPKPLKTGIKLAKKVFQLYYQFLNLPEYDNQQQASVLIQWIGQYKKQLKHILQLFRNSFCSTYEEEQMIQQLLFIGLRGCIQFQTLYQIMPANKNDMCMQLKDSFQTIVMDKPIKKIQQEFIHQLFIKRDQIIKEIKKDQLSEYIKYLRDTGEKYDLLKEQAEFKQLWKMFLQQYMKFGGSAQQKLISFHDNLQQHIKLVKEKLNSFSDDEEDTLNQLYPEEYNFKFYYLLLKIGHGLMELQRSDKLKEDKFFYQKLQQNLYSSVQEKNTISIKQKLTFLQSDFAKRIFMYVGCVESVFQAYQSIIKTIPENNYLQRIKWLIGLASYCEKNGRIQQAHVNYQKAQKLSMIGNLMGWLIIIKGQISNLSDKKDTLINEYYKTVKEKKIIDPNQDVNLQQILQELEDDYINPYQQKNERQN